MVVIGFDLRHGGERRVIVHDLVGGRGVHEEAFTSMDHTKDTLEIWSWGDPPLVRKKLVTRDVARTTPPGVVGIEQERDFPPDGGVGLSAMTLWSWYPEAGTEDELLFPKGAVVTECRNVNDDWFHGSYMGARGLFPANYVKVLDRP